jgi:hypothetical protein
MYKCGWNGCEKAYGTLNHLNAHVTMQSHGVKRTPEGKHSVLLLPSVFSGFLSVIAKAWFGLAAIISRVTRTTWSARWSQ